MATASRGTAAFVMPQALGDESSVQRVIAVPRLRTIEERLFAEPFAFDFFQAVRLLELVAPERRPIGKDFPPGAEVVRLRAHLALNFPPSAIYDLIPADADHPNPSMTVAFMGLVGPSGMLPRHYTELLLRLQRDARGPERYALGDWFALFEHRILSLFFRSWTKYRFWLAYERREHRRAEPDSFTLGLFSLVGLGTKGSRNRLRVSVRENVAGRHQERVLARVEDLSLLYFGGFFSHFPRCASSLEALLHDYFGFDAEVQQFRGQWLQLDASNQSRLGSMANNNELGVNVVAGTRVWDVQSKIRIRLGPLNYQEFNDLLPDHGPTSERKTFLVLAHLTRLYVGPEIDIDIQLLLRAEQVPECQLPEWTAEGPQLGWNAWISSQLPATSADDAVFEVREKVWLNDP